MPPPTTTTFNGLVTNNLSDELKKAPKKHAAAMFRDRVDELQERGLIVDPIQILMELAAGRKLMPNKTTEPIMPPVPHEIRQRAAEALCKHMYPTLKAVELSGNGGDPIRFVVAPDLTPLPGSEQDALEQSTIEGGFAAFAPRFKLVEQSADLPPAESDD